MDGGRGDDSGLGVQGWRWWGDTIESADSVACVHVVKACVAVGWGESRGDAAAPSCAADETDANRR